MELGIDRTALHSPKMVAVLAVVLALALGLVLADQPASPMTEPVAVAAATTGPKDPTFSAASKCTSFA